VPKIDIPWKVLLDKPRTGAKNMKIDLGMFKNCTAPVLRIYSWTNRCISYGCLQKIDRIIDVDKAVGDAWEIVKRPTGGGVVYHLPGELTYCAVCPVELLPKGIKGAYYYISEIIVKALNSLGIDAKIGNRRPFTADRIPQADPRSPVPGSPQNELCFSSTREYEITAGGKKLVGSAQKRGKKAVLQQGTVQLSGSGLKCIPSYDEIASAVRTAFECNIEGSPLL